MTPYESEFEAEVAGMIAMWRSGASIDEVLALIAVPTRIQRRLRAADMWLPHAMAQRKAIKARFLAAVRAESCKQAA